MTPAKDRGGHIFAKNTAQECPKLGVFNKRIRRRFGSLNKFNYFP